MIKVISLARSIQRRATFAANNSHIDFEFFDAVDGHAVAGTLETFPELFEPGLGYSPGAVGCALSHLTLWQEAAESGQAVTVVEDDAILRHDFHSQAAAAIADAGADWDLIVWGWNFDSVLSLNLLPGVSPMVMLFNQAMMRGSLGRFQQQSLKPQLLALDRCFGTPAYSISAAGARKFMAGCFPLSRFQVDFPMLSRGVGNTGIDIAMNRLYSKTASFCSMPPLALTCNDRETSLIQGPEGPTQSLRMP